MNAQEFRIIQLYQRLEEATDAYAHCRTAGSRAYWKVEMLRIQRQIAHIEAA